MKAFRLNRLFHSGSRRCVGVAFEAGTAADESGLDQAVRAVVEAGADALELTIGQADALQRLPGKNKPALILRADVTNLHRAAAGPPFSRIIGNAPEQAVRLDATAVIVSLMVSPGHPELTEQCLENIHQLKPECERWCLPLIIEPLVFCESERAGDRKDAHLENLLPSVQQAVSLGADLLSLGTITDPTTFPQVVKVADSIPVFVRLSGGASRTQVLAQTETLISQGASGIIADHLISQRHHLGPFTRALLAIVHDSATTSEAMALIPR